MAESLLLGTRGVGWPGAGEPGRTAPPPAADAAVAAAADESIPPWDGVPAVLVRVEFLEGVPPLCCGKLLPCCEALVLCCEPVDVFGVSLVAVATAAGRTPSTELREARPLLLRPPDAAAADDGGRKVMGATVLEAACIGGGVGGGGGGGARGSGEAAGLGGTASNNLQGQRQHMISAWLPARVQLAATNA